MATLTENINKAIADFNGIKTAITEKGVPVADTDGTETYAAAVKRVYAKGKADELDAFWDAWQDGGNRTDYDHGFAGWTANMAAFLKPKYDIHPTYAYMMFGKNKAITDLVEWCEDCGITLDFSNCTSLSYLLLSSTISRVGVIDAKKVYGLGSFLSGNNYLTTVDKVIMSSDGLQKFNTDSFSALNLENITFDGVIGNNIWFHRCTKLTTASLLSILTALTKDSAKASGKTITLATAHKAKIEADTACTAQLNAAIAAGWTVAYA